MRSSSHGKACPQQGADFGVEDSTTALDWTDISQAEANVQRLEELNAGQRGRSWSLPIPAHSAGRVPAIASCSIWLDQVRVILASDRGAAIRGAQGISADFVVAVAEAMTKFATGGTGRDVTASNEALALRAGVSTRAVRRARKVLSDLGLAVEMARGRNRLSRLERLLAEAHHGGRQTRAASVWYLTSPREAAMLPRRGSASLGPRSMAMKAALGYTQVNGTGHLPTSRWVSSKSLVRNYSPTRANAHAGARTPRVKSEERRPRALHLQQAAAELVHECIGMDRGQWQRVDRDQWLRLAGTHIGAVCDVIASANIDTTRWDGRAIARRISEENRRRGLAWPQVRRPIGFLKRRLSELDWTEATPAERAAARHAADLAAAAKRAAERAAVPVVTAGESPAIQEWRKAMDGKFPSLARNSKLRGRVAVSR